MLYGFRNSKESLNQRYIALLGSFKDFKNPFEKNLSEKNLSEKNLSEKKLSEKKLSGKNLSVKRHLPCLQWMRSQIP
jgi:uncharacterized protein YjbI with pentapeptide repeats